MLNQTKNIGTDLWYQRLQSNHRKWRDMDVNRDAIVTAMANADRNSWLDVGGVSVAFWEKNNVATLMGANMVLLDFL